MIDKVSIIRSSCKNLRIVITNKGEVIVHAPNKMSVKKIEEILKEKESWIVKNVEYAKKNMAHNKYILNYTDTLLCGKPYCIKFGDVKKVAMFEDNLIVPNKNQEDKLTPIKKWYKKMAAEIIEKRITDINATLQLSVKSIKIVDCRRKWGSCDSNHNIKINWRLVMLSPDIIDFVIIHELVHILQMNHSKAFFDILTKIVPDWKERRRVLKTYNFLLELYR